MEFHMFNSSISRHHADGRRRVGWMALLAGGLGCLLAQSQALAGLAPGAVATVTPAPVQYLVINLLPASATQFPAINARGQVAMSVTEGDRCLSWFSAGRRLQPVLVSG